MTHDTGSPHEAEALGHRNHDDLLRLRHGFDDAYDISVEYPRSWSARRLDDGTVLAADSADGLRRLIISDYSRRPVPRQGTARDD